MTTLTAAILALLVGILLGRWEERAIARADEDEVQQLRGQHRAEEADDTGDLTDLAVAFGVLTDGTDEYADNCHPDYHELGIHAPGVVVPIKRSKP